MSTLLLRLNIVFVIFLLPTFNHSAAAASINYNDYNSLDINAKDSDKDYWNKDPIISSDLTDNGVYYFQECKPITSSTTSVPLSIEPTGNDTDSETPSDNEAQDIVVHVIKTLRSMKKHTLALIKNMDELEADILASSSTPGPENLCKNSTNVASKTNEDTDKITYPDVLSQKLDWSAPLKINSLPESGQTNEFLTEAHEAVQSWKQQIDACKNILDNAVHNALHNVNLRKSIAKADDLQARPSLGYYKNSMPTAVAELSKDLKQEQDKSQKVRSNDYKFHSLYDAFRMKKAD